MSTARLLIGHEEYMFQMADKRLYYCKVAVFAQIQTTTLLRSDHLNSTTLVRGQNDLRFRNYQLQIVTQTPLDDYEKSLIAQIASEESGSRAPGRVNEFDVVFEIILLVRTWGKLTPVGRVLSIIGILLSISTPQKLAMGDSLKSMAETQLIEQFYRLFARKIVPINKDWLIEILTATTHRSFTLQSSSSKSVSQSRRRLERLYAFRYAVDPTRFEEFFRRIDQQKKEELQRGFEDWRRKNSTGH